MAPNGILFILFFLLSNFAANDSVEPGCARKDALVEKEGRLCAAPCTRQRTCRSPERECRCDGVCGRTCIIKGLECPVLSNLSDGHVLVHEQQLGSKAIYTCDRGFKLIGLTERVCQGDGSWSGHEPSCLELIRCYVQALPKLDGVLYQKELKDWYLTNETVGFICSSRYQLTSGHLKGYIECLEGQWLLPKFGCEPRSCPPFMSTDPTIIIESSKVFKHGESNALNCYDDYVLHGSSQITCQFGTWLMPDGRTYCQNTEYQDETNTDTNDPTIDHEINYIPEFEVTTEIPTTPEPVIDDGITIPIIEWIVDNGDAMISEGNLYVQENSDLQLICKWSLNGNPLWIYSQSRDPENYKITSDFKKAEWTSTLTIWSIQEDDSGTYSCFSPLKKRETNLIINVLRQPTDEENQTPDDKLSSSSAYSCVFHRPINTIAWYSGRPLHGDTFIPDKGVVTISCREIGQFLLVGSPTITCTAGEWIPPNNANCIRLKRNSELFPPPIEILTPYAFLGDGSIAVDPKQNIELHCMWVMPPEPQDTWYHATWYRSDETGNLVLPAEIIPINKRRHGNGQFYSYRLSIDAVENSVTTYTCLTPENESNSIKIRFTRICKYVDLRVPANILLIDADLKPFYLPKERIDIKGCKNNKRMIGLNYVKCLENGVWAEPLVKCQ